MKKIILISILSVFLTFNNSFAQKANLNVAVIDVEEVLKNSLARIRKESSNNPVSVQASLLTKKVSW